jgi:DNA-binding protein H-NS
VSGCPGNLAVKPKARRYIAPITIPKEQIMRKPRDFDSELKALEAKAKQLKARKVLQLGELVIATGADSFDPEMLAGCLLEAAEAKEATRKEAWRKRGQIFFRSERRNTPSATDRNAQGDQTGEGHAASH